MCAGKTPLDSMRCLLLTNRRSIAADETSFIRLGVSISWVKLFVLANKVLFRVISRRNFFGKDVNIKITKKISSASGELV